MRRHLREMSRLGCRAFWLGIATVAWGILAPAAAGTLTLVRPDVAERDALASPFRLDPVALDIALAIAALVVGLAAQRRGERSRLLLAAFVPGAVMPGFGLVYMLSQVLGPH